MAQIPLVNTSGKKVKSLKVSGKIFGAKVNPSLVNQAVRVYLSNQRQASARTKSRGEVKVTKAKNATLILAPKPPANIVTATKNLPRLSVTSADKLTTYQALSSHQLIFTEKSLKSLTDHYAG